MRVKAQDKSAHVIELGGHCATVGHWKDVYTHSFPGHMNPQVGVVTLELARTLVSPKSLTNLLTGTAATETKQDCWQFPFEHKEYPV